MGQRSPYQLVNFWRLSKFCSVSIMTEFMRWSTWSLLCLMLMPRMTEDTSNHSTINASLYIGYPLWQVRSSIVSCQRWMIYFSHRERRLPIKAIKGVTRVKRRPFRAHLCRRMRVAVMKRNRRVKVMRAGETRKILLTPREKKRLSRR